MTETELRDMLQVLTESPPAQMDTWVIERLVELNRPTSPLPNQASVIALINTCERMRLTSNFGLRVLVLFWRELCKFQGKDPDVLWRQRAVNNVRREGQNWSAT